MEDNQAYEKLQEILRLAEEVQESGEYSLEEILDEIKGRLE